MGRPDSSTSQENTTGEHTIMPAGLDADVDTDTSMDASADTDALADSTPHGMSISQAAPRLQHLPRTIGETLLTTAAANDARTRQAADRVSKAFNRIGDDLTAITEDDTREVGFDRFAGQGLPFCKPAMRQSLMLLPRLTAADPSALLQALTQALLNRSMTLTSGTIISLVKDLEPETDIMSILRAMQAGMRPAGSTARQTRQFTAAILLYGYWTPTISRHIDDNNTIPLMRAWDTTIISREHILHPLHWDEDLLQHPHPTPGSLNHLILMMQTRPYYQRLLQGMASIISETHLRTTTPPNPGDILHCAIHYAQNKTTPTQPATPASTTITYTSNPTATTLHTPITRPADHTDTPADEHPQQPPTMLTPEYPGQAAATGTIIHTLNSMDTETLTIITLHEAHTEDTIRLLKDSITYGPAYAREAYKTTVRQHR